MNACSEEEITWISFRTLANLRTSVDYPESLVNMVNSLPDDYIAWPNMSYLGYKALLDELYEELLLELPLVDDDFKEMFSTEYVRIFYLIFTLPQAA